MGINIKCNAIIPFTCYQYGDILFSHLGTFILEDSCQKILIVSHQNGYYMKEENNMKKDAYLLEVWYFDDGTLKDPYEFWFVVTKSRGYEEFLKVKEQSNKAIFNHYHKDLLSSMFGKWS